MTHYEIIKEFERHQNCEVQIDLRNSGIYVAERLGLKDPIYHHKIDRANTWLVKYGLLFVRKGKPNKPDSIYRRSNVYRRFLPLPEPTKQITVHNVKR
ncbi:MAG: hypothetical protein JSV84_02200, partial [Gemmatimonadota bacterium]